MNPNFDLLAPIFFPGNKDPMSPLVRCLDRATGTDLDDSSNFIDYVFLTPATPATDGIKAVLINHGMSRTLDENSVSQWQDWATDKSVSVLLHNYPGYGSTPGPVTANKIMDDQRLLVRFLLEQRRYSCAEIAVLGNSIGCGPTLAVAELYDFGKIVLVSPYISCCSLRGSGAGILYRALSRCLCGSWIDLFDVRKLWNLVRLRKIRFLVVCGENDKTIDPINSQEICEFLGGNATLCVLPGVDHRLARLSGDHLIGLFLRGLEEELQAAIGRPKLVALENPYSD